jgi:hypothetical protein
MNSGTALESKSSDLDVFEPGATATFPNLQIWTPANIFKETPKSTE